MLSSVARRRALLACACFALATPLAGAGCATTASSSGTIVTGKTLTIYVSAPPSDSSQADRDVLDAERLALAQNPTLVGKFTVRLASASAKPSDNARTAVEDSSAIAYIGEVLPGRSGDSLGIANAEGMLQVTPTDTDIALTQKTAAVSGSPGLYYESLNQYGRTFARVVPDARREAKVQVEEMRSLGVSKLCVADDGQGYGDSIALSLRQWAASSPTVSVCSPTASGISSAGANALFLGASSPSYAAGVFNTIAAADPHVKLFGPSSLEQPSFAAALSPAAQRVTYVSSPGFLPADLTAAGKSFVSSFTSRYGHAPSVEAIFGYAAMQGVLDALQTAGTGANNRGTVVRDFISPRSRTSVLGSYSVSVAGDTSLAPFVFSRVSAGKLVPFKFLQG